MKKIIDEFTNLKVSRQRKWQFRHPDKNDEIVKRYQKGDNYKKYMREYYRRTHKKASRNRE